MHNLLEYLNRSTLGVYLIEHIEEVTPQEFFTFEGKRAVLAVVSSKQVVLQRRGDNRKHVLVGIGDEEEKLIDEGWVIAHPFKLDLALVDSVVIEAAIENCAQSLA